MTPSMLSFPAVPAMLSCDKKAKVSYPFVSRRRFPRYFLSKNMRVDRPSTAVGQERRENTDMWEESNHRIE